MAGMKATKTIAIVDGSVARTGAFVGARNIAFALKETAEVIIILPGEVTLDAGDLDVFVAVHRLPIANLRLSVSGILLYLPKLLASSWSLNQVLRREGCQNLILNDFYLMHGAVCRLLGYRGRILSWVRMDPLTFGRLPANTWLRIAKWSSDELVAVSRYIESRVAQFADARVVYDPLACSTRPCKPTHRSERRPMVFVGNYIKGKGQDDALEAFARIAGCFPDAELAFFGGDMGLIKNRAFRLCLQERAQQLGLGGQVAFHGFIEDPQSALADAYLALNFSVNESFSMTVLEASAAGLPVIATRCGGPEEIIEDGVTGVLVPVGDIDAMAEAMQQLLRDPNRAADMGTAGRSRVMKCFSREEFRRNVLSVLELS
jgi:glycosyltransferase involved in cell wall biosynthesis